VEYFGLMLQTQWECEDMWNKLFSWPIHYLFYTSIAESYLEYEKAVMLHSIWLTSDNSFKSGLDDTIARLYMSALIGMSSQLADSLVTFDIPSLVTASGILWQVCYID
jgi:hypothetical protein